MTIIPFLVDFVTLKTRHQAIFINLIETIMLKYGSFRPATKYEMTP